MSFLKSLDKGLFNVITVVCGVVMILLLIIINVQVFARFVFNFSLGGISDLPPYLMIYTIWLGGIMAARNDDHISIQLVDLFVKNKKVIYVIDGILYLVTAIALFIFMKVSFDYTVHALTSSSVDQGTHIPLGYYYMVLPFSSCLMGVYYVINTIKKFIAVGKEA